jgi:hypothetical protein
MYVEDGFRGHLTSIQPKVSVRNSTIA